MLFEERRKRRSTGFLKINPTAGVSVKGRRKAERVASLSFVIRALDCRRVRAQASKGKTTRRSRSERVERSFAREHAAEFDGALFYSIVAQLVKEGIEYTEEQPTFAGSKLHSILRDRAYTDIPNLKPL